MPLDQYRIEPFDHHGLSYDVYWRGSGPGVVVMAEMPGITPEVVAFADACVERGMTVAMPSMFGTPGAPGTTARALAVIARTCIRKEFGAFARKADRPVTVWLRALAAELHHRAGGPGVGAVGMCFTGGFALAMMVDDIVVAPVLSQPSLPLGPKGKADIGVSDETLQVVRSRVDAGCQVLGLRFTGDSFVPEERFESLKKALGDGFVAVEIPSPDPTWNIGSKAHSVITTEVVPEQPDHPATRALAHVVDFLSAKLEVAAN